MQVQSAGPVKHIDDAAPLLVVTRDKQVPLYFHHDVTGRLPLV